MCLYVDSLVLYTVGLEGVVRGFLGNEALECVVVRDVNKGIPSTQAQRRSVQDALIPAVF